MSSKKSKKDTVTSSAYSTYGESDETLTGSSRIVKISVELIGDAPGRDDWTFLTIFNGLPLFSCKWQDGLTLESKYLSLDLLDPSHQNVLANKPVIFILRSVGKGSKEADPLLHTDNRAGAAVDLFPLVLGQQEVFTKVTLLTINTGEITGCTVQVRANCEGEPAPIDNILLHLTMISAHCLPNVKENTVYIAAIGMNELFLDEVAVNFGMSLSTPTAQKVVWGTASNAGYAANTAFNVPDEDMFVPSDLEILKNETCNSVYWNAMKRVLVEPGILRDRVSSPFIIEVAGVPKSGGKMDVRGRYMTFLDAKVLLEPGQYGVTMCSKLLYYNESSNIPNVGPLLVLPPTSAKLSVRESNVVTDEFGHPAYIVLRIDLPNVLTPKDRLSSLYEHAGLAVPDGSQGPVNELEIQEVIEDAIVDVRRIRKESGALTVHKELSVLSCRRPVPMNQGLKRTAANRLLMRVRTMLKQFPPGDCSEIVWQDTVTAQHAAARRAVTASFAPQPPPSRLPPQLAAARSRLAEDYAIAEQHMKTGIKVSGNNPRLLLSKVIRNLEEENYSDAGNYLLRAVSIHSKNRFLLWAFGALEYQKGIEGVDTAAAAFRISVKSSYSEGIANAIGWAALHALHHSNNNPYAAFVSLLKMRKSYELARNWKAFIQQWIEISGEEEVFWKPAIVSDKNPLMAAATFFLCLRSFSFAERLLKCYEDGCFTRGALDESKTEITQDLFYLRAVSLILRRDFDKALDIIEKGIKKFGPTAMLSQLLAMCLICVKGWDGECESAMQKADKAGAEPCSAILLKAAKGGMEVDPQAALQRAARAHKMTPCGHSALIIGRIYAKLGENALAERWTAVAVEMEPLLADGWAFSSLLSLYERNLDKARCMLRTAKQVGTVSPDIEEEVKKTMKLVQLDALPDALTKDLCLCGYY